MKKTAVLALGGNAIIKAGEKGTISQQFANTRESLGGIVELISRGYHLSITHGNGPQVGNLLRQQEAGEKEGIAALPLGVLNAATEGTMGYMIEQSLQNKLHNSGIDKQVITIVSQVVVDKNDPSMLNPTKFVGSTYYSAEQAEELKKDLGWTLKKTAGKAIAEWFFPDAETDNTRTNHQRAGKQRRGGYRGWRWRNTDLHH
jgi:carbamate kinase